MCSETSCGYWNQWVLESKFKDLKKPIKGENNVSYLCRAILCCFLASRAIFNPQRSTSGPHRGRCLHARPPQNAPQCPMHLLARAVSQIHRYQTSIHSRSAAFFLLPEPWQLPWQHREVMPARKRWLVQSFPFFLVLSLSPQYSALAPNYPLNLSFWDPAMAKSGRRFKSNIEPSPELPITRQ